MTKYFKQTDGYNCVPMGIMNAWVWSGLKVCRKTDLPNIQAMCKTTVEDGTSEKNYTEAVQKCFQGTDFYVWRVEDMTLGPLTVFLANGSAILLTIKHLKEEHVVFIDKLDESGKTVNAVNWAEAGLDGYFKKVEKTETRVPVEVLGAYMLGPKEMPGCEAFILVPPA